MNRLVRRLLVSTLAILALGSASAAQVTASFSQQSGSTWAGDFTINNDGAPDVISGVTVFFSESLFANLIPQNSPTSWDSIVIQPDLAIPAAGFLDTYAIDPGDALLAGQSRDGFRVEFTYLESGAPPMLPFDIVDENFGVLFSGTTTAPVPEPGSGLLLLLGLAAAVGKSYAVRKTVPSLPLA